jgi:hypothetical protein
MKARMLSPMLSTGTRLACRGAEDHAARGLDYENNGFANKSAAP